MKLLVGLGNPGSRYAATRHNVGFRIVESFGESRGIAIDSKRYGGRFGQGVLALPDGGALEVSILEPQGYMNRSGEPVAAAARDLRLEDPGDLLVAFDDVDLPFGRLRLRARGSAGGHRGLADIIEWVGRGDFPRLRFGVDRPPGIQETAEYVLEPFASDEEKALPGRLAAAADAIECALVEGLAAAMSRFNRDPQPAAEESPEPSDEFSPTDP